MGVEHEYKYLDKNIPKDKLSYMEQRRINEAGGIKNLANKRNAMSEARYKEAEAKFNK